MNDMTSIITTKTATTAATITTITADDGSTCQTLYDFAWNPIDIIRMNGKVWLSAPAVLAAMGFPDDGKNTNRSLQRVQPVDIIKATSMRFQFTDGRRNASSFISPRAVMMFAQQKVKGMNPFKANDVVEWMLEDVLHGRTPEQCSPWMDMWAVEQMESMPSWKGNTPHSISALRAARRAKADARP